MILCSLFAGNLLAFPALADGGNSTNSTNNTTSTLHSIIITVTANPTTINLGEHTTLTVTVLDNSSSPTYPTGTTLWTMGTANGTFSPSSCTLSSGSCTTLYTPASNSPNSVTVTASYAGDSTHHGGAASSQLTANIIRVTATSVTPNPATVSTGSSVSFVGKVTDMSIMPTTSNGTLSWTSGTVGGTFSPSSCTLSSGSCTTLYTPASNSPTAVTITATYTGDSTHSGSAGISSLTVNVLRGTTTTIVQKSTVSNGGTVYMVKVNDTSGTKTTPTGTVSLTDRNAAGIFNATSCTLSSGACVFLYTPNANAPNVITINATYTGDSTHLNSIGSSQLSENTFHATTTTVTPNPALFTSGNTTTFTATVSDTSNPSANLIGIVSWSDSSAGGTFNPSTCILSSNHCSLAYTPHLGSSGTIITATYAGDSVHYGSSGTSSLSVNVHTQQTTPSTSLTPSTTSAPTQPSTPTVAPAVINASPYDTADIVRAKSNQTIAAEINVINQTIQTQSIDNSVSVKTNNTSSDSLSLTVSASSQTSPKVVLINLGTTSINVANLKDLEIMYDGKSIQPATDVYSLLHVKNTDDPKYAIVVTQSEVQILVSVPHFSTHTITITNMSKVILAIPEFPLAAVVLVTGITVSLVFYRIKGHNRI